jgi:ribonuclease P protein component
VSADAPSRGATKPLAKRGNASSGPEAVRPNASFPRARRLLKHADFERVYQQGRRHFSSHMTVFYQRQEEGAARVGFTVGRVLGGAAERNRIKRRLREAVRLRHSLLTAPVDVVINPKKSVLQTEFRGLLEEIERAFEVISRKLAQEREGMAGR